MASYKQTTISDIFLVFVKYASAPDSSFLWKFFFFAKCLLIVFLSYGFNGRLAEYAGILMMGEFQGARNSLCIELTYHLCTK
ncbi:hypothetical protein CGRA01v4_04195 [Colletotrichum graminicola]|nr:hypothetical protein CGRA01v4_04195 [Colletotrichum graminicola]